MEPRAWGDLAGRLLVLCTVGFALACGDQGGTTTTVSYTSYEGPGVGVTLEQGGVVVQMDSSVHYESTFHSQTGKPTVRTQTMNGLPFELVAGGFTLGGQTFEGLAAGDRVLITADGILVNGEKRWELPRP
jgi:hypothetical protein